MKFLLLSAVAGLWLLVPPALAADGDDFVDTTVLFSTFDGDFKIPMPTNGPQDFERIVSETCNGAPKDLQNAAFTDTIIGAVVDIVFTEFRDRFQAFTESFVRTYAANKNIPAFDIPLGETRCISIARLKVGKDGVSTGYYSYAVLALIRTSERAMILRPLYLHTPAIKTAGNAPTPPQATAVISFSMLFLTSDNTEAVFNRAFAVPSYEVGADGLAHVFALAKNSGENGGFAPFEDAAFLPYPAGQPVSIALSVSENSRRGDEALIVKDLSARNAKALTDRLKLAPSGN